MMKGFLAGKKVLIIGVASNRSIAWGIANAMHQQGADLAFSYQNEKLKSRVAQCAKLCDSNLILECDVGSDESINTMLTALKKSWQHIDCIVHSVAFADREALNGNYVSVTTRENFLKAHDISAYSLTALAKAAKPMLSDKATILSVSYLGAVRAIPNYNIMGIAKASLEASVRYLAAALGENNIRVNAISAGPIKTLAASGIKGFSTLLNYAAQNSALKRNVTIEEVGNTAAFLASDLSSGITGEIIYVDAGYRFVETDPTA